jgi:anti-sigma regulatory factor (Ser/Thr protein kinase)
MEDDGKPFNLLDKEAGELIGKPLEELQIGGLGIHFVKEMMDEVHYSRENNRNMVTLIKKTVK